ncbi:hypothetical protein DEO72_LG7g2849 [Vigna unguiculata]|uniref:PGG domain-containing protein n=1 Tax=Vigna unguiculata TaxID=3917 RepID=A0A4D6MLI7_VIGUN|nr:hypothetical protein DEO72_LG7g2849 [Vigna unguiculata]
MNPDVKGSDVPHIQITITADQNHYQNLNRKITADEFMKRTEYEGSYELYWNARMDKWSEAHDIVKKDPNSVRIPLTARDDTVLHVAAGAGSYTFVEELAKLMNPEDVLRPNSDQMLPVHLAALSSHHRIVQLLCSHHLLDKMTYKDIEKLFFMTISNNMFGVSMELFRQRPTELAIARDEEKLTALHMLARKPSEILLEDNDKEGSTPKGLALFMLLWVNVSLLEKEKVMVLINEPSAVLLDAIKSGNIDATGWLITQNLKLFMTIKDPSNGRNLLHLLVQYRHPDKSIKRVHGKKEHLLFAVDNDGNNVLHLAAHLPLQFQSFSGLRASKQMLNEVQWFKSMERSFPSELSRMRNNKGKRPVDVFYDEHKQLSEEIKGAAKVTAKSGMLVATLVATVAFAAVLTVPGGDKNKNSDWFIVFILTNTVALFTSSASILSFLSNFTSSRFSESEFVTLHPGLIFGPPLLIISVGAMVLAFTAASFLIFDIKTKWVSYVVALMWVFPLFFYLLFQFSIFDFILLRRYGMSKLE